MSRIHRDSSLEELYRVKFSGHGLARESGKTLRFLVSVSLPKFYFLLFLNMNSEDLNLVLTLAWLTLFLLSLRSAPITFFFLTSEKD